MTTEATSFVPSEYPSFTRTEGERSVAGHLADDSGASVVVDLSRTTRAQPSETAIVDLSRVFREFEESIAAMLHLAGGEC